MEEVFSVRLNLLPPQKVVGAERTILLLPFTGEADGKYFVGNTQGPCVDTQTISLQGTRLSARYLLVGKDYTGAPCRIFIENNGGDPRNCTPSLVTDSPALAFLEREELISYLDETNGAVTVHILRKCNRPATDSCGNSNQKR